MRRIVAASPDYLRRHGEPKTPEALLHHQTIQFGPATTWHFLRDGRDVEVTPSPRFISNSSDAVLQYAEEGGGLTRVLAYQAADGLKRGRLKIVLAKFEQPALPIHIVYPTSRLLSAKVRAFIDLVVETTEWRFG
jgi:DNA-binding transcriptional LysR family regulator